MIITYYGGEFFKVQFGDTTLAFNPISKDSKLKSSRFGADIVLSTTYHSDFNGIEQVSHGDKKPFVISGPGEYEVKEVFIKGLPSESKYGVKDGGADLVNTIYTVSLENMNICFLGAINNSELKTETVEALDEIDILFVPIGGEGVLDPVKAYKLAISLEPKIIIPMHFGDIGTKDALKVFLKEAGENPKAEAKLTLKKKDLEGKKGDILLLDSVNE
jgi:L-ascorbate metabolism protein UlaG (beta-lactamase superfamily)